MISIKHISTLLLSGFLLVSCAPFPPGNSRSNVDPKTVPEVPKVEEKKKKSAAELKREADRRKARAKKRKADAKRRAEARKKKAEESGNGSATNDSGPSSDSPTPPKPKTNKPVRKKRRTAVRIPGKAGFVFNPWTNKAVDVRGIPSGELVRDPKDPDSSHVFRVP